nr:quinate repressor protein [Quercus suber]
MCLRITPDHNLAETVCRPLWPGFLASAPAAFMDKLRDLRQGWQRVSGCSIDESSQKKRSCLDHPTVILIDLQLLAVPRVCRMMKSDIEAERTVRVSSPHVGYSIACIVIIDTVPGLAIRLISRERGVIHAGAKRSFAQMQGGPAVSRLSPAPTLKAQESHNHAHRSESGYITPVRSAIDIPRVTSFASDASVVLIGVRGVGKSSLGVLAATAYGRRLVDTENEFLNVTGNSTQAYRKLHGTTKYIEKHHYVLTQLLEANSRHSIIVCSFSDLENNGATIIREYAQTHPVINISRDAKGIQSYLGVWTEERVLKILQASGPILRSCSSYDFFNLSDDSMESELANKATTDDKVRPGKFLTLKRVERDFLKLLGNIIGEGSRMPNHHSAYPLSQVQVHQRQFTFAAVVHVGQFEGGALDINSVQIGADAVELRVTVADIDAMSEPEMEDYLVRITHAFAILRRQSILPIIHNVVAVDSIHARSVFRITDFCLRLAPEYCTVDMGLNEGQIAMLLSSKGRTRVILKHHASERPEKGWNDSHFPTMFEQAAKLGCEAVQLTMPASNIMDNFSCAGFRERIEATHKTPRLIAYNTGREGKSSLVFNSVLTPVNDQETMADKELGQHHHSQVTARSIVQALAAAWVFEPMRFFIYGANVSFSLSPAMHNAAYTACGLPHTYTHHSCNSLEDIKSLAYQDNFGGAAVVQPWKTGVLPLLGGMSSHAKVIGAVNTIVPVRQYMPDGSIPDNYMRMEHISRHGPVHALYGYNTDWIGIRACLRRGLSPANTVRAQSTGLVCGAGGQARSAIYSMLSLGIRHVFVVNRTRANAHSLAEHYNNLIEANAIQELFPGNAPHTRVHVLDSFDTRWPNDYRYPTMIVSSIPTQSSKGTATNFRLNPDWLKSPTGGAVVELAYRPTETPVVLQMRAEASHGWVLMDGFDVLPEQAFAQFELFTGRRAPRKLMREEVMKRYKHEQMQIGVDGQNRDPNPPAN